MYAAKSAGQTGPCGIFWTLTPHRSGLQHRLARDDLFKRPGIKIRWNPACVNSANYSLPYAGNEISNSRLQQVNGSFRAALLNGGSGPEAASGSEQIMWPGNERGR